MTLMHSRILVVAGAALVLAGATAPIAFAGETAPAAHKPRPQLTARPDSAKAGTKVLVTGTGFKPRAKVTIAECSVRSWIAPRYPCTKGNSVTVRASKRGLFHVRFTVRACPPRPRGGMAARTSVCYLGEPHGIGVDVISLVGATAVTITA